MSKESYTIEQKRLRLSTEAYFNALPPMHREVFALIGAEQNKTGAQIIANSLERTVHEWRSGLLVSA